MANKLVQRLLEKFVKAENWPAFSEDQIAFLEARFPARVMGRQETVEEHLRYAGMVELIAVMRLNSHLKSEAQLGENLTVYSEEELEALQDAQGFQAAEATLDKQQQ